MTKEIEKKILSDVNKGLISGTIFGLIIILIFILIWNGVAKHQYKEELRIIYDDNTINISVPRGENIQIIYNEDMFKPFSNNLVLFYNITYIGEDLE